MHVIHNWSWSLALVILIFIIEYLAMENQKLKAALNE